MMKQAIFVATLDQLYPLLDFIQSVYIDQRIRLAAEEAVVNIINYSYPNGPGFIEVLCGITHEEHSGQATFRLLFKDEGIPFNPLTERPPPSLENLGGYGIRLYCQLMDRVEYRRENHQNILEFIRLL